MIKKIYERTCQKTGKIIVVFEKTGNQNQYQYSAFWSHRRDSSKIRPFLSVDIGETADLLSVLCTPEKIDDVTRWFTASYVWDMVLTVFIQDGSYEQSDLVSILPTASI